MSEVGRQKEREKEAVGGSFLYGGEKSLGTPAMLAFSDGYFSRPDWLPRLNIAHRLILPVLPYAAKRVWLVRDRPIRGSRSAWNLLEVDWWFRRDFHVTPQPCCRFTIQEISSTAPGQSHVSVSQSLWNRSIWTLVSSSLTG